MTALSQTAAPAPYRGPLPEFWRWLCAAFLRLRGWRLSGAWPAHLPRVVLIAAPHTSNWDGVVMLAAAGWYRVPLKWMGRKSLTEGPFGGLIKWLGCVPVDRSGKTDLVASTAAHMRAAAAVVLAVAPEGTRAHAREWKSGFYHIALAAGAPLVMSILDYGTKTITIAGPLTPSGDYAADLAIIRGYYANARGLHDERVTR